MDNRVYYGEYSLKHWIDLILKGNIILPDYQRYFVWNEQKVETLIDTFKKKQFVPPVTIGAFKSGGTGLNLILDGQQRLTSILLAFLGLYPDKNVYKRAIELYANENDEVEEEGDDDRLDNVFEWTFKKLIQKGKTKPEILGNLTVGNYKTIDLEINDEFFKSNFLGFSYLVPYITDEKEQQKYYSSVFRNINVQGQALLPQESRASLYYLDQDLAQFFNPLFLNSIKIKTISGESKMDFVRFLSLLSQFRKDGNSNRIARGYKPRMETYYEEYINSAVGENSSHMFIDFLLLFPNKEYSEQFERLKETISSLDLQKQYTSIIDLDIYFFGLIYEIIYKNKGIDVTRTENLKSDLASAVFRIKGDSSHTRAPGALKYLKQRIDSSVSIYKKYEIE